MRVRTLEWIFENPSYTWLYHFSLKKLVDDLMTRHTSTRAGPGAGASYYTEHTSTLGVELYSLGICARSARRQEKSRKTTQKASLHLNGAFSRLQLKLREQKGGIGHFFFGKWNARKPILKVRVFCVRAIALLFKMTLNPRKVHIKRGQRSPRSKSGL